MRQLDKSAEFPRAGLTPRTHASYIVRTMSRFRCLLALVCLCLPAFAQKPAPLGGQKVLWLGDSITQAGDYVSIIEYFNPDSPWRDKIG